MNRENGGTILGLIIGLVFGLGIAVVVALMITKASTPFTNKLGMSKPADAPVIQLTDPNKPLYGNSYKEAPANLANSANSVNKSTIENAANTITDSVANAVTRTPETVKFNPKSAENLLVKNNAEEKAAYYLQVGAFRDGADAENVRAKLALIGIESNVTEKNSEGDNLYRVRVGPFDDSNEMNRTRKMLAENSIDVAVIKTPK